MNSFLIKDFIENKQHVYYGCKNIEEYITFLLSKKNIKEFIIEKKSDDLLQVFQKIINKGYIYNSISFQSIFSIEKIHIEKDNYEQKKISEKFIPTVKNDEFITELKNTLSKRLKNKLD